jgi:nucleoside-diphosphate-sugar epimerase
VQVRVVRIFNTYGPHMALDDGRVVSNFVAQALTGQPLTIYGDGQQTRSFQYVSDLVEGAPCALLSLPLKHIQTPAKRGLHMTVV